MANSQTLKTGVFVTSRNNYEFMDRFWLPHFSGKVEILNIDEDSSPAQKKHGQKLADKHCYKYLDREERGMQHNIITAANYFQSKNIDWGIWFQHDCWPLQEDFFERFDTIVRDGKLDQFGTIGFNVLATDLTNNYKKDKALVQKGEIPIGILARCPLEGNRKWYAGTSAGKIKAIAKEAHPQYTKPFAVEVPAWLAIAVNFKKYRTMISPCSDYQFFHAWDDVAFQFLKQNIYNIAIPNLYLCHRPDLKPICGLPSRSVKEAKSGNQKFHGKWGHLEVWKKRWGWDWEDSRTFEKVKDKYLNTLLSRFYKHNPDNGPLATFEV